jgi:ABC-type uncharacterized transport system permease subunit
MLVTIISLIASGLYCLSAFLIYQALRSTLPGRWRFLLPAVFAILCHAIVLNSLIYQPEGLNLSFFIAFSLISWLVAIQIILSSFYRPVESLGIAIFPISALASLFSGIPLETPLISTHGSGLQGHILISIIAYSLLTLGAFQASILAFQDHAIRSHKPGGFTRLLPPMHDMETLLFQFLAFGFVFLSASLLSGFLFLEDIFAQHLVHKTALSLVAWLILAVLLFGRLKFGWRGKTAIRWTLVSFAFLVLAFFGSKLVLEIILQART